MDNNHPTPEQMLMQAQALRTLSEDMMNHLSMVRHDPLNLTYMTQHIALLTEYVYGLMHSRADELENQAKAIQTQDVPK